MSRSAKLRTAAVAAGIVLVALLGGAGGAWLENHNDQNGLLTSVSDQKKVVTNQSQLISQIAKTVGPSVVSVNANITDTSANPSNPFSQFGGGGQPPEAVAAGTGIIISDSGLIVTNRHVVPVGSTKVTVTLSDGTELKDVTVVGRTSDSDSLDVAFLKINDAKGKQLKPAVIGDSAKAQVGDDVVAIGNALGQFQNTVTSGIISGYGRSVQAGSSSDQSSATESLENLIQTDAAINEGNSGGPLVNLNGQVIGINTAVASGGAQNVGFAIPVNDMRGLINQVLKTGKFERPYLGVRYVPLTADIASQFNLNTSEGAFILPSANSASPSVLPNSPAAAAGLKEGDIIVEVEGKKIDQTHSLTSLLSQHQPGDKVTLTVKRDNQQLKLEVTLGTLPASQ
ncbi:MAG: putative HtrA2 peptidase [Candidatus Saccharibacteria bacterium]|nr:putative HtrA2 peptidase [Candidatus Saccharibacteria bacterium]